MPEFIKSLLKPIGASYIKRKIEISKRNGWRHAIFKSETRFYKRLVTGYYKGEWKNDKKEGKGSELNRNGFVYEGDWLDGKRHGYGVLSQIHEDGTICMRYIGQWMNGKKNGFGYSWYKNDSYYEGEFYQNKREGYGRIWYCNGDHYEGNWKNDLPDGIGIFVKFSGNRYEGEFVAGKKEGRGTFYHIVTGQKQSGIWRSDSCISSTMSDMYLRQSAPIPTPYPIPRVYTISEIKDVYKMDNDNTKEEEVPFPTCKRPLKRIYPNICVSVNTCPCLD
ncbi:PREDICTED: MORN repeat-containing protein 3-like [Dufourea novaeangliae]|uniref:MORN repeat-containing protein 3-like n=1 Tax=Dufourea novaeangliae TaxID=178035 RepID=UPI0007670F27|nr:PREDICTED: MORN repeat-containing protein 3-like [Dufourea novaeangliae]